MMHQNTPLSCTVKPPVLVRLGDHKVDFHSGCSIVEVTFNSFHVQISEIHFHNHHTAWLTLFVQIRESMNGEPIWKTAVDHFEMMPQPHADVGGEDFFTITRKHMNFDLVHVSAMRFVLRQPSPIWKEFKIEDLAIYKNQIQLEPEVTLPTWLSEDLDDSSNKTLDNVTSLSNMCSALQQMWAMIDSVQSSQSTAGLGRYDVDGSYEINLLSYT